MDTVKAQLSKITGDKLLLAVLFILCLLATFWAQHSHNENLIQWLMQTTGQFLAALLALLVGGNHARSTDPKEEETKQ